MTNNLKQAQLGQFYASGTYSPYRNRIINGDMRIDQRSNGAAGAVTNTASYVSCDRWSCIKTASPSMSGTVQRDNTVPDGFSYSLLYLNQSGSTPAAGDANLITQKIEGFNVVDFNYGKSTAKTTTLSFWTYIGQAGLYSGSIRNSAANRSYVFTFQVNNANTWEYKTITIPGCIDGTWLTDNGIGMYVSFDLGSGSNYKTSTLNTWITGNYVGASTATAYPQNTTFGSFRITGVQLELGSIATPFEIVDYGEMLRRCQRYYELVTGRFITVLDSTALTRFSLVIPFNTVKRADPSTTVTSLTAYNGTVITVSTHPTFKADGSFLAQGTTSTNLSQTLSYIATATHASEL